jgi:hypothetical protein
MPTQTYTRIHWLNSLGIFPQVEVPPSSLTGLGNGVLPSPMRTEVEVGVQAAVSVVYDPSLKQKLTL